MIDMKTKRQSIFTTALVLVASMTADPVAADDIKPADVITFLESISTPRQVGPSIFGIASGFGMSWGTAYMAASFTNRRLDPGERAQNPLDGSYAFGLGLIPSDWWIGADAHLGIISATPGDQDEAGNLGYKIHTRWDTPGATLGFALGAGNVLPWGEPEAKETHHYGVLSVASKSTALRAGYILSLGYSTGISNIGETPAAFAGLGWTIGKRASGSIAWAGDEWLIGGTVKPLTQLPVFVSLGLGDVDNRIDGQRVMMTFSYVF